MKCKKILSLMVLVLLVFETDIAVNVVHAGNLEKALGSMFGSLLSGQGGGDSLAGYSLGQKFKANECNRQGFGPREGQFNFGPSQNRLISVLKNQTLFEGNTPVSEDIIVESDETYGHVLATCQIDRQFRVGRNDYEIGITHYEGKVVGIIAILDKSGLSDKKEDITRVYNRLYDDLNIDSFGNAFSDDEEEEDDFSSSSSGSTQSDIKEIKGENTYLFASEKYVLNVVADYYSKNRNLGIRSNGVIAAAWLRDETLAKKAYAKAKVKYDALLAEKKQKNDQAMAEIQAKERQAETQRMADKKKFKQASKTPNGKKLYQACLPFSKNMGYDAALKSEEQKMRAKREEFCECFSGGLALNLADDMVNRVSSLMQKSFRRIKYSSDDLAKETLNLGVLVCSKEVGS